MVKFKVTLKKHLLNLSQLSKQHQQQLMASLITFVVSLGVIGLRGLQVFEPMELKSFDYLMRSRPSEKPDDRIVIVEISETDIQRMAVWPWSDRLFADLIDRIAVAKPVAIGIDKYLDIPVKPGRDELIAAMKQAGNVVNVTFLPVHGSGIQLPADLRQVSDAGFSNIVTDAGSVVRRALLAVEYDSFPFRLAQMYLEKKGGPAIQFHALKQEFTIGDRRIPRFVPDFGGYQSEDASGYQIVLNYRGPAGTFRRVSAVDVLTGKVAPELLRDRIVLIGSTAVSLKDSYPTPFSTGEEVTYGVEVHANITSQILSAALDNRPFIQSWSNDLESLWIVLWAIGGGVLSATVIQVWKNMAILVGLTGILSYAVWSAFLTAWWLPFFPALTALLSANFLVVAYRFSQEQADRKLLMGLFSRHVSKELVDVIWENREKFMEKGRIEGQEVYVTVLFTDMRNFSTAAEAQKPGETLNWLNSYLGAIASEVIAEGGMVDKYIGDAVMAVFGVPVPHDSEEARSRDAQNAVRAAIEIGKKLLAKSEAWKAEGLPEVATGIGINSGMVIAGSLGSAERLEYSVIGDAVNVAARLESFNKEVDGGKYHILISQDTYERLDNKFATEYVGSFALKGRTAATAVYRVVDYAP